MAIIQPSKLRIGVRVSVPAPIMNQYKDPNQVKSLIKQAFLINQVLDEYNFTTILDIGTGPGIIKRVLVKQGKLCHTVEQYTSSGKTLLLSIPN